MPIHRLLLPFPTVYRVAAIALLLAACADAGSGAPPIGPGSTTTLAPLPTIEVLQPSQPLTGLTAVTVAGGFDTPVDVAGTIGDERLFVVEKAGVIRVVDADGQRLREPFLDLRGFVLSEGNEQGLTTLELHPQFTTNGRVFVFYTDLEGNGQVYEYTVDADDPDRLDQDSGRLILEIPQPDQYHQSGTMTFGPEGYLWLSLGDGGGQYDPFGNGQDPRSLLGTILRLDVDNGDPYAIPPDNPYVDGDDARPEVWAYGLRNPWRITVDDPSDLVYIADVSQDGYEEINIVPATTGPHNFGWPIWEGSICLIEASCDAGGFTQPIYEYPHDGTCAIVGGDVYRGAAIPELHGHYFFVDHCAGEVHSLVFDGTAYEEHDWLSDLGRIRYITSWASDATGEIVLTTLEGQLLRIEPVRG